MIETILVETKTPADDHLTYAFLGDLDKEEDQGRLLKFMLECCDKTAAFFPVKDGYTADEWKESTQAMWYDPTDKRQKFGETNLSWLLEEGF